MRQAYRDVYIVGTGSYSPGQPIPFDNIEDVLGRITEAPPKVMAWTDRMRPIMKEMLGLDYYYYALDPKTREPIDNNVTMSCKAAQKALDAAGMKAADCDLIIFAGILMENICPPTTVLIQEELKIPYCAEYAIHSNCTSVYKALQLASDLIANGRYNNALVMSSQLSSSFLRSEYYNQKIIEKTQVLLRWFLCDGAGSLVLSADKNRGKNRAKVVDTYIESVGLGLGPDMYCRLGGHRTIIPQVYENGWHHLTQNFDKVAATAPKLAKAAIDNMLAKTGFDISKLTYFFANVPTKHLNDMVVESLKEGRKLENVKFYTKLAERGYPGPCAIYIALDEFLKSGEPKAGDLIMSMVTESSKWMHGGFILEYQG